jgi:hypothetical protein
VHPDDVADHVASSVEELVRQVARRPDLNVTRIDLEGPDLRVHFDKKVWATFVQARRNVDAYTGEVTVHGQPYVDLRPPGTVQQVLLCRLDGYDAQPPTAELLDADGRPLPSDRWPREIGQQGIVRDHPDFGRPFFCRRGLREYHSHFQHEDDPWDRHREGLALHTIVIELLDDLRLRWTS